MTVRVRSKIAESELAFPETADAKEHRETREALVISQSKLERAEARLEVLEDERLGHARALFGWACCCLVLGLLIGSGLIADVLHSTWP